jgi:hypothetical protein
MRTTIVLLGLFGLAHSTQIYTHPSIDVFGVVEDSYASAFVAQHLHLDRFEAFPDLYTGGLDQAFVGKGAHSSLLIGIDSHDVACQWIEWRIQVVI